MTNLSQSPKPPTLSDVLAAIDQRLVALSGFLKEAVANENNSDALRAILEKLSLTSPSVGETSAVLWHQEHNTEFGPGVRFVQPQGMTLRNMMEQINSECLKRHGRGAIHHAGLFNDDGIDTPATENIVHELIPVVLGTDGLSRDGQKAYMEERGMSFADRTLLAIASGLVRLKEGYPANNRHVGTERDNGELLQGKIVRVSAGALESEVYGVVCYPYWFDDAKSNVAAAGTPTKKS